MHTTVIHKDYALWLVARGRPDLPNLLLGGCASHLINLEEKLKHRMLFRNKQMRKVIVHFNLFEHLRSFQTFGKFLSIQCDKCD